MAKNQKLVTFHIEENSKKPFLTILEVHAWLHYTPEADFVCFQLWYTNDSNTLEQQQLFVLGFHTFLTADWSDITHRKYFGPISFGKIFTDWYTRMKKALVTLT